NATEGFHGRDVDDAAAFAASAHQRNCCASNQEHVAQVDVIELVPLLFCRILEHILVAEEITDVVDEHIEAAMAFINRRDNRFDVFCLADISLQDQMLATDL